jgi:hypothetical protein
MGIVREYQTDSLPDLPLSTGMLICVVRWLPLVGMYVQ